MALVQQLIALGTSANDRTGTDLRAGGTIINSNFTQLFNAVGSDTAEFVAKESDFTTQDATTITLKPNAPTVITASFSTAKNIIATQGSSWTSRNINGPKVTFTGTGTMFSATDVDFYIHDTIVDAGIGNQTFVSTDTIGGSKQFICINTRVVNTAKWGTFTDLLIAQINNCSSTNANDGIVLAGTSGVIWSVDKFALTSTSAGFKGIDMGSATATVIEYSDLFFVAPAGAFGLSGLASSGNVLANRQAEVSGCDFLGGMTDLENITNSDLRYEFQKNTPTANTLIDGMLSLTGNATETVISAANTPVLTAGTWVVERASKISGTTAGRETFDSERDQVLPIDVTTTISAASGTNKDITVYLALNGTVISNSAKSNRVGATDPKSTGVLWQLNMTKGDYLEVWVENNTDSVNLIVEDAILRVR